MSNLTTLPKGDSAWLLRKSIQRIMQQVSVLETNIGSSTTGNSADTQVIFNDAGTLRGDTGLTYDKSADRLSFGAGICYGLLTSASATITGDLTVDTSTLKVDSANNYVGIGTASPVQSLTISGEASVRVGDVFYWNGYYNAGFKARAAGYAAYISESGTGDLVFANTASSAAGAGSSLSFLTRYNIDKDGVCTWQNVGGVAGTAMTLNANGLGIGVTPSAWWSGSKAMQIGLGGFVQGRTGTASAVEIGANQFINSGIQRTYINSDFATYYEQSAGQHIWYTAPSGTAGNAITFTQAMMLDASGNLLVGLTVDSFAPSKGIAANASSSSRISVGHASGTSSGDYYHSFAYNSTVIGSITQNGTTGVLYNINSDYRLKESVAPLSGGLARVSALKPSMYKWKSDGSSGEGFLAHELAEVVPAAVTGEKDAVNEDGSIKSQGVDMSRVVPILVAAIQELTARVQTLEAK